MLSRYESNARDARKLNPVGRAGGASRFFFFFFFVSLPFVPNDTSIWPVPTYLPTYQLTLLLFRTNNTARVSSCIIHVVHIWQYRLCAANVSCATKRMMWRNGRRNEYEVFLIFLILQYAVFNNDIFKHVTQHVDGAETRVRGGRPLIFIKYIFRFWRTAGVRKYAVCATETTNLYLTGEM